MNYQQFIIKAMNYDHGGSHDSDACNMQMLFNWDTEKLCIIFTWWRVNSIGFLILSCFIIILLATSFEFLRFALRKYDTKIQVSYSQLQEGRDANSEEVATQSNANRITYVQQLVRTLIHTSQVFLSFFLMLVFMTYNGFLMISVIIGAAIGYFVFSSSVIDFGESAILIKQGAEARIYTAPFLTRTAIIKERFSKTYRHPTLDKKLTARRVTQEARCLFKCRKSGVDTPVLYFVNTENSTICMEFIQGMIIKDLLISDNEYIQNKEKQDELAEKIGIALAKVHAVDVIHGDLTTSNLMLRESNQSLVIIDFGLSYVSSLPEDKAVDLYVLEKAFLSTHPNSEEMFANILEYYQKNYKASQGILSKLAEVRLRGRKRSMVG
ncbi:uncharacterized protein OCT59_028337 [Rhizophagus irregularis]|uniref:Copper transport protein n=1 Tax=Rhizophagus irregularis TaxID=588596 RepID=A0A915YU85_9GLOM|nr:hypothetical protein OCT59_028337 [Rhizophagus irregularis]CAB4473122.1 unnamed protein product [Rhizophagus irregularis]CAB5341083.1 unnamed protein product [Rhizophagus irregularis]